MDSDDVGGSVCGDAGVVVRRSECEFAVDLSEPGEFSDGEFGIYGVVGDRFAGVGQTLSYRMKNT